MRDETSGLLKEQGLGRSLRRLNDQSTSGNDANRPVESCQNLSILRELLSKPRIPNLHQPGRDQERKRAQLVEMSLDGHQAIQRQNTPATKRLASYLTPKIAREEGLAAATALVGLWSSVPELAHLADRYPVK